MLEIFFYLSGWASSWKQYLLCPKELVLGVLEMDLSAPVLLETGTVRYDMLPKIADSEERVKILSPG